jgi:hypothetical protein
MYAVADASGSVHLPLHQPVEEGVSGAVEPKT